MAAKKKTKKAQKKKQAAENEILVYIYALVLITLSIIGCLEIGFLGNLITGVIQYVTGNLYGVVYGLIIVFSFMRCTSEIYNRGHRFTERMANCGKFA